MTQISCQELTELVSPYVEGTLPAEERARLEVHLGACEHCADHLDQLRATIVVCGHIEAEALSPSARDELARAFGAWRAAR